MALIRCRGFSLIEVMISILIGSLVMAAATGMIRTSALTRGIVSSNAELQQEAFFATHALRQQLAQIGYRSIDRAGIAGRTLPIASPERTFPAVSGVWEEGQTLRAAGNSLWYRFDGASAADGSADGSIYDCLGNALPFGVAYEVQLSLQANQLVCTVGADSLALVGSANGTQVEQLEFSLGVDTDGDNGIDLNVAASAATAAELRDARHIMVRMLLASPDNVLSHNQTYRYQGVDVTATDRRVRNEVVVSVGLRNQP